MKSTLENKLTTSYNKDEMISFLKLHPEFFEEAIRLAISDKQPYSWRAAYSIWGSMEENDNRIRKFINVIIKSIPRKDDGHQRELLKILYKMKISEKHEGKIFDICMNLWEQINKKPSVRMIAFRFIFKISNKHPELLDEITFLTQERYLKSLSPGIRKTVNKMIKEIE